MTSFMDMPAKTVLGRELNNPDSPARGVLSATYAQQWKVGTAYAAGQAVIAPSGDVVKSVSAFTSGSAFNSSNWERVLDPTVRQGILYGSFMKKLRTGVAATINCLGDSTTYGYDTVSADKVAPPPEQLPDGTYQTATRSPAPWPSVLQSRLAEVYPAGVTVINRGRPGDTTTAAIGRWPVSSGADLTCISFGINDATLGTNPNAGDLTYFLRDYERIIRREINDYNAAVVILTPAKQSSAGSSALIDVFRNALDALAGKFGVPVIDIQEFLAGYDSSVWSDGTHLTTKGNAVIGAKLAACFMGKGPYHIQRVSSGTRMSVRPFIDNVTYAAPAALALGTTQAGTLPEGSANAANLLGKVNDTTAAGAIFYSFYAYVNDIIVMPNYYMPTNTSLTVSLDFGVEQPHDVMNSLVDVAASFTVREPSTYTHTTTTAGLFNAGVAATNKYLRIASPGWHSIKITGSSPDGAIYLHALEFLNYRSWKSAANPVAAALHVPVPPNFSSTISTTSTSVKVADLITKLGIPDWGSQSYKAPAWKVTIRSYGQRVIEYLLSSSASPTAGTGVEKLAEIRNTALITTPNEVYVHEIQSVTWDDANKAFVFTWKTLNADGTTAKDMTRNFIMDISVL